MTLSVVERTRYLFASPLRLDDAPSKAIYAILSAAVVLAVRLLENAVHEYAHAAVVMLSGGEVVGLPTVTPFGGFIRWSDVPDSWLSAINIAGTAVSVAVMLGVFLPLYFKGKSWGRWIGYWGACVVPVNAVFYWFAAPFIASAEKYDPVAFAHNMGISPVWIVGLVAAIPFTMAVWWMVRATRALNHRTLVDPRNFHVICLALYYIVTFGFTIISYVGLLDELVFQGF